MKYLRQSTVQQIVMGPFVDKSDGVTPLTDLTITSEAITYIMDGAATINSSPVIILDGATASGTGDYALAYLGTGPNMVLSIPSDGTVTLGSGVIRIEDPDTHVPVWEDIVVLPQPVYDSLVTGDIPIPVDVEYWVGNSELPEIASPTNVSDAATALGEAIGAVQDAMDGLEIPDLSGLAELLEGLGTLEETLASIKSDTGSILEDTADLDLTEITHRTHFDSGRITIDIGATEKETVPGLTISTSWKTIYMTFKRNRLTRLDSASMLQIMVNKTPADPTEDGIQYIEGQELDDEGVSLDLEDAILTVDQAGGSVSYQISAQASSVLMRAADGWWDIKQIEDDGASRVLAQGRFDADYTVTRRIS
jgi:hypothetical protein